MLSKTMITSTPPINNKCLQTSDHLASSSRGKWCTFQSDVIINTDRLIWSVAHLQKQKNYWHYSAHLLLSFCQRQLSYVWLSYEYCPGRTFPWLLHGSWCPRKKSFVLLKKLFMLWTVLKLPNFCTFTSIHWWL